MIRRTLPNSLTTRRVTLALLVLPPLIALALLACATLAHHPRPVHTGDALLDTYLQALVDRGVVGSVDSFFLFGNKDTLPPALWKEWEQQYGSDPRFWMLCYYARPYDPAYGKVAPESYLPDANYLREARKSKSADWIVLQNLLDREALDWNNSARSTLALASPGNHATQQERERYDARIWEEVTRLHGAELTQLLTELRQAGEEQAQAHYYLAEIAGERGDVAGALKELASGNAAPHNDGGLGQPFDALTAAARRGQPLAGDSAIAGQMKLGFNSFSFRSFIRYRNMVKALTAWAVTQKDLAALQIVHNSCCRYGASDGAGYMQAQVAIGYESIVLDAIQQITPHSATVRHQTLIKAQSLRGQLDTALRAISPLSQSIPAMPSVWDIAFESEPAISNHGRYYMLIMLRRYANDLISEQTALAGPVRQQFEALAAIDFAR